MPLWRMRSSVLNGYYASEIFVAADTFEDAVELGLKAFDQWIAVYEEGGYNPLTELWPEEPGYAEEAARLRQRMHDELISRLKSQPLSTAILVVT